VDRVYVEFPDVAASVDDSVFPELIRVLVKGGKITVRHREGAKSFEDRLVCDRALTLPRIPVAAGPHSVHCTGRVLLQSEGHVNRPSQLGCDRRGR